MKRYPPSKVPIMPRSSFFQDQMQLLLEVLPELRTTSCFALKGGTAINLFFRDFPRLSVDIDLTYVPIEPREIFLKNLTEALEKLAAKIEAKGNEYKVKRQYSQERQLCKLSVTKNQKTTIKIESNLIIRGCVFGPSIQSLSTKVKNQFFVEIECNVASFADVYAGKLCAALDRRHPRDLFDVKLLFESEGLTNEIRQAFVVYLASTDRPMHEILNYRNIDIAQLFEQEFSGMTDVPVTFQELEAVYQKLVNKLKLELTENERKFLLSIKKGEPAWSLMPFSHLKNFPSLKWKLMNIEKMSKERRYEQIQQLKRTLQF